MKRFTYAAVALLAIGGAGVVGCTKEETKQAAQDTNDAAKKAKDAVVGAASPAGDSSVEKVKGTLESIVEKVGKRNDWNDMADNFTADDMKRVKAGKPDSKDLDELATSFAKVWSQKYGGDTFSVISAKTVFAPDFVTLATDASGTKDRPKATGAIKESHGMPALSMNFVGEGGNWRLDIPDTVDAQKFHDNLKAALAELQDSTKWPDKKEDGYRAVSHRILAAVLDKAGPGGSASAQ